MSKTWVFTLNNPEPGDDRRIQLWTGEVAKMMVTLENSKGEGTPHFQGSVTFKTKMGPAAVQKLIPRARWSIAFAKDCCFIYCAKVDGTSELICQADNTRQGSRADISAAYEAATAGRSLREFLTESQPGFQAIRVFQVAQYALTQPRPIQAVQVYWRWGPTGTGKTRWAYETYPDLYNVPSFKWWDGYTGQKTVLFDDIRGDFCPFHEWLKLLDMYPIQKETKGGWVHVQFTTAIITCPYPPEVLWASRTDEDIAQLMRRITHVEHVGKLSGEPEPELKSV